MKKEEVKKDKKINKKKILIISIIVIVIIGAIICFFATKQDSNSITSQFDKILNSNNTEIIFFERQGNFESDKFKELLDTDLKEQGITYTTIDLTNATYEELEHIKLKFNISSEDFNYYIVATRGSENLFFLDYSSIDRAMFTFANNGLLKNNQEILNEYHYNLGKQAFENGNLGAAKDHLEKVVDYKDEQEILSNKRFYLVEHEFEYTNGNEGLSGRHIDVSLKYHGGSDYTDDWISVFYWNCELPYGCLYSVGNYNSWDARMTSDNKILLREFQSSDETPFEDGLDIEILSENQIKIRIEGNYYTLTKTS